MQGTIRYVNEVEDSTAELSWKKVEDAFYFGTIIFPKNNTPEAAVFVCETDAGMNKVAHLAQALESKGYLPMEEI